MRDMERLREKVQLSLDDRQIAVLAVCALLLLGGVFALGVLVGKRLAAAAPAARSGELSALDEAAQAPPEPEAKPPPPPAAGKPAKPPPAPGPSAAGLEKDLDDEQPVPEQGKPPESAPPAQAAMVPVAREPVVIEPAPKPRTIEPAPAPVVLAAPPRNLGAFTVQIGASQDHGDAQKLESRARLAGLKPYVVEARLGNKGTWYRVRVGAFNDKTAADSFRRDVERELRVSAMVMPTR